MEHKTYHGRPVIWSPQPRQAAFMARTEDEALYGGAAGGGKSDALIIEALRQVHIPHYRALILRKTYPQLSELIDKTMRYYKPVFPKARYNGSSHCWTFPSGAKIYFGSLNHTQDKYNYQGKPFDLQLFAEGGDGAGAAGGTGEAAAEEKAASAPAQGKGREAAAAEVDEMLSPAEEPDAEEDAAEGEEQDGAADKSGTDPEAHRKAFGELMRGEYNREFGEMIVQATQKAYDSILNEQGPVGRILNTLGQKYGTAPGDYEALAAAVEGGVVKDDAYYEDMAMKKGISVQLAKEMDALESENAKHRAAEQQRAEAAKMEAIQQEWDAAAERIRAEDPGFDIKTALADPDFAQMLKLGVKMEDAYKARYFDDIMARKTAETAKKTESGVVERIRQRGARPSENGTNPGGAAVLKTDVSKLTPAQCEELERRAMRGQIITF